MNAPSSAGAIRLRQWFDSVAQAEQHFQRRDKDEVLFFVGPQLMRDEPVLLEVAIADSDQTCLVRGRALRAIDGPIRGSWLSFPTAEVVKGMIEAVASKRRRAQRVSTDLLVNARAGLTVYVSKLVDVSSGGARLNGLRGIVRPGMEISLSTFGKSPQLGQIDQATLMWQRGLDAGVRFLRRNPPARQTVSQLVSEAKQKWHNAIEARHPAQCHCHAGLGSAWEPPMPRERWTGMLGS